MRRKKEIVITGATGSVGSACLSVIRENPDIFRLRAVSGHHNLDLLESICREFKPDAVSVAEGTGGVFARRFNAENYHPLIFEGTDGLKKIASEYGDTVGRRSGGNAGKTVALANKESLVLAGKLIMETARRTGARILPMDSEHNAVYQALGSNRTEDIDHIILTSSGGPFLHKPQAEFSGITPQQAMKHPNWSMGKKISIDSATMMNKSLEVIEAAHLFSMPPEKIRVVIHPEVIIHSAVAMKDGSVLAQMGTSDMRIPAAYCLGGEERILSGVSPVNFWEMKHLTFLAPDILKFPTLRYAYDILKLPDSAAAVFNGANEELVSRFLAGSIPFTAIFDTLGALHRILTGPEQNNHALLFNINSVEDAVYANTLGVSFAAAL
ncbi:hypothetical protein CHS0354_002003 [Potamilus streckersoni]|uniref:1-deoxy-D-xylulose-5-phosphate reductoisomerase n=1 Tax=Potamilus streckersoni TaxID=2493646 RepID=A0AAE0T6I5_9BIVA|nr:hypothetical protein CHS0354_002003 [Potamilus streckersoni]